MNDKLRDAAQAAVDLLKDDDRDIYIAIRVLEAALAEPEQEYICKCGLRVVPHQCKTDKEF